MPPSLIAAEPESRSTRGPGGRRRVLGLAVLVGLLAASSVASLLLGVERVPAGDVWHALVHHDTAGQGWIVLELRVPRTVLGLLVGLAIGLSAALIQAVTRNPLADTQVLGVNSGASLVVVCAIAFGGVAGLGQYLWFAFAGALLGIVLVVLVGSAGRMRGDPVQMLLAGVAVGAVMDGVSFTVRLLHPRAFDAMRFWDVGALDERPLSVAATVAPFIVVGAVLCFVLAPSLNAVALGDDLAVTVGARTRRTRVGAIIAVTLLAGGATAACGPIGFVGLMVPHIVRRITGPDWRWILLHSAVLGPVLLLLSDVLGRLVVPPAELPAGIVTAFVGAPVLVWLVRREGARS